MPKQYGSSVTAYPVPNSHKFPNPVTKISKGEKGMLLRKKLSTYDNLTPQLIDVLVFKLVYKWSYADIAKHFKWHSRSSASHAFSMAKAALVEKGIKI